MMQTWADWALDTAQRRGATYADVRVMDIRQRDLSTKNGEVGTLLETRNSRHRNSRDRQRGLGICFHRSPDPRRGAGLRGRSRRHCEGLVAGQT